LYGVAVTRIPEMQGRAQQRLAERELAAHGREVQLAERAAVIPERWRQMAKLRADGLSLQQVGDRFGLRRERVRQILEQYERHRRNADQQQQRRLALWYLRHPLGRRYTARVLADIVDQLDPPR
jgi:DNA-directed RNA polymerase sigma subunit (sigma70/sigma32)